MQTRGRTAAVLSAAVVMAAAVVASTGHAEAAGPPACPLRSYPAFDTWVWTGGHVTDNWFEPANWDHTGPGPDDEGYPGAQGDPNADDDYVCIPPQTPLHVVEITDDDETRAEVKALHNAGEIQVSPGGRLQIDGDPDDVTSYTYRMLLRGALAGQGEIAVGSGGRLIWRSGAFAATMTTRLGNLEQMSKAGAPPRAGRLVVRAGATLDVRANPGGGLNLEDSYVIENHGTTILRDDVYIAASYGTRFRNLGRFILDGDGDYPDGFIPDPGDPPLPPSRFDNGGLVTKVDGAGHSILDTDYRVITGPSGPGRAEVSSGALSIWAETGDPTVAVLDPEDRPATLSTGGCAGAQSSCAQPAISDDEPQAASLTRPQGTSKSNVRIRLVGSPNPIKPIDLTVPRPTSLAKPMRFLVRLDSSVLGGDDHESLDVTHNGVPVLDCQPAVARRRCVDRDESTTKPSGDVTLMIRTVENGRWRLA